MLRFAKKSLFLLGSTWKKAKALRFLQATLLPESYMIVLLEICALTDPVKNSCKTSRTSRPGDILRSCCNVRRASNRPMHHLICLKFGNSLTFSASPS